MVLVSLAFAFVAALLAGADATRRGRSWLVPAVGVGAVALVASLTVTVGTLLSAYDTLGGTRVVVTPLEFLVLGILKTAVVAGTVLVGYGVFDRLRRPA